MAGKAFLVVVLVTSRKFVMGVMAGNATDAAVSAAETLAERQPVGLKADVRRAAPASPYHGRKGSMASPAETRHIFA